MPGLVYKPRPLFENIFITCQIASYDTAFKLKTTEVAQKKSKEATTREYKIFQVYSYSIGIIRVANFTVYY